MTTPFDLDAFRENVGGDDEVVKMLCGLFQQTADSVFQTLNVPEEAMDSVDYVKLWKQQLHLLRGSGLNIGALDLSEAALEAEMEAEILTAQQKNARLNTLKSLYADVKAYIQTIEASHA